jgi:hypothetical protein
MQHHQQVRLIGLGFDDQFTCHQLELFGIVAQQQTHVPGLGVIGGQSRRFHDPAAGGHLHRTADSVPEVLKEVHSQLPGGAQQGFHWLSMCCATGGNKSSASMRRLWIGCASSRCRSRFEKG